MSKSSARITVGVAMVALLAMPAAGQTDKRDEPKAAPVKLPVQSFDDLKAAIDPEETLEVAATNGQFVIGRLSGATSSAIEIRAIDSSDSTVYSFDHAALDRIVEKDSTRNGTIAGAVIGAIPALIGGLILNKVCYNEVGSCPASAVILTALGGGIGAGIGFIVDNGRQKLIYDRKLSSPSPTIAFHAGFRWR